MKVFIENLGVLKKTDFEIGNLTIICGANNTGKTYATYALYGFLDFWQIGFNYIFLNETEIDNLFQNCVTEIKIIEPQKMVDIACKEYIKHLPRVFATRSDLLKDTSFKVLAKDININELEKNIRINGRIDEPMIEFFKKKGEYSISIKLSEKIENPDIKTIEWLIFKINKTIFDYFYLDIFPTPFIASIERTGAAIFQKELDFTRSRLLEHINNQDKEINPLSLLDTLYISGYALPVNMDVNFTRGIENVEKKESIIAQKHPDIIKLFEKISGGKYGSSQKGLYFIPEKNKIRLAMGESSSSVRSLLNIGFYIKHILKPGDFFMIDEPELNLHPKNQRNFARLLAKLINAGVNIYITTHSDYILKEFNTLIMLHNIEDRRANLMNKHQYEENELLDEQKIKAHIAKKALIEINGFKKKQRHNTIIPTKINKQGIEISEFDDTINEMNDIQDDILYGE